jgi:hypothetical protein
LKSKREKVDGKCIDVTLIMGQEIPAELIRLLTFKLAELRGILEAKGCSVTVEASIVVFEEATRIEKTTS